MKFSPFTKLPSRGWNPCKLLRLTFAQCKKAAGFFCQCHLPCATSQTGLICKAEKRTDPTPYHLPMFVKLIHVGAANSEKAIPCIATLMHNPCRSWAVLLTTRAVPVNIPRSSKMEMLKNQNTHSQVPVHTYSSHFPIVENSSISIQSGIWLTGLSQVISLPVLNFLCS